jgi:hypothetical protein
MKSKEFFDLAVKMRYVQKHYYLSTDKETRKAWRRACKAYEKKMDDEIDRVTAISSVKKLLSFMFSKMWTELSKE